MSAECRAIAALRPAALHRVLELAAGADPLRSLVQALAMERARGAAIRTLHVVAHGEPGAFVLAGVRLDRGGLLASADALAQLGVQDLALWCCELGRDREMVALLEELSGARVWSTTTALGLTASGRHWQLDRRGGAAEQAPQPPFARAALDRWDHRLDRPDAAPGRLYNSSRSPWALPPELAAALAAAEQQLLGFLQQPGALAALHGLMPGGEGGSTPSAGWLERAESFRRSVLDGSLVLRQEVRSTAELGGAHGAFAAAGPDGEAVLYINASSVPLLSANALTRLVLEETGHWIDHQLNGSADSLGDEGEAFAAQLLGLALSDEERGRIRRDRDAALLTIVGVCVAVELSAGTLAGTGQGVNPSTGVRIDPNWDVVAWPASYTGATGAYDAFNPQPSVLPTTFFSRTGYTANGVTNYWMAPNTTGSTFAPGNYNWIAAQAFTVPADGLYSFSFQGTADNAISFYINGSVVNANTQNPTISGGTKIGGTYNNFRKLWDFNGAAFLKAGTNTAYMVLNDFGSATAALITQSIFQSALSSVSSLTVNEASPYAVFSVALTNGQNVALALANGTATGGSGSPVDGSIDYGSNALQYSLDNGSSWINYSGPFNASATGGASFLVRTTIVNDISDEPNETFFLNVTPAGGTVISGTATINDDDLSGDIYIGINNITVNEASPHAVFSVAIPSGLDIQLFLANATASGGSTAPSNGSVDFNNSLNSSSGLQYSLNNGATWINYNGARFAATLSPGTTRLLVRTSLVNDRAAEGNEAFTLTVVPNTLNPTGQASGSTVFTGIASAVAGTATINDQGSGEIFLADGSTNPAALKDDDRPLSISSPSVNESAAHAVFAISGGAGQLVGLALTPGTATPGAGNDYLASLEVSSNGGASWSPYLSGSVALNASGALLVRVPVLADTLSEPSETFTLIATNTGGTAFVGTATISDTPAPVAPAVAPDLIAASDTGASSTDNITADSTPTFDIPVLPSGVRGVQVFVEGVAVTSQLEANGDVTITSPVADGPRAITYAWIDGAGGVSAQSPALAIAVDATAPAAPTSAPDLLASSDTGASSSDNITSDSTPTFDIPALPAGVTGVRVYVDGVAVAAVLEANGDVTITSPLGNGSKAITYAWLDGAGNVSAPSPALSITIDTVAPSFSGSLDPTSDSGTPGDGITNDTTPTFSGTGTPGDTITIKDPLGATIASGTVQPNGSWSVTPSVPLANGPISLTLTATDAAGNSSAPLILPITIDSIAPAAPTVAPDLLASSDTGASSSDNITSDSTPTFDLPALPAGVTGVRVYVDGVAVAAVLESNGDVTITSPLSNGSKAITYAWIDAAGNISGPSPALPITITTAAPAAPTSAPDLLASSDTGASSTDNITADTTPTFDIPALPAGVTGVKVYVDGTDVAAVLEANGDLTITSPLGDGTRTITYAWIDGAGNISAPSPALLITIDSDAPAAPLLAPDLIPASDTGSSNSDYITSDTT
ncbi:MAG: Ig-like domain-containing protein, partial [Prochlorococcaceae cyanobacterium]